MGDHFMAIAYGTGAGGPDGPEPASGLDQRRSSPIADSYRGWAISWDYGYFTATGPDYDASWEGEEDGWIDNGQRVTARTRDDLITEVNAWFEGRSAVCGDAGAPLCEACSVPITELTQVPGCGAPTKARGDA